MKPTVLVHVYNFIRMSHVEPSRFIEDDFDTVRREITLVKQYGFPGTYALKYDALMEPRYQSLLKTMLGPEDEISAWWEITRPLCEKAGVPFPEKRLEDYDDRVDSAYSIGYTPEDRCRLVDAYMADFLNVFGFYPKTIGSWVLDSVTLDYAARTYGIQAAAICRDQLGTDGFTLWGGYPNGAYYPSRNNEYLPAQTPEDQIPIPVFRLLGPDPIYNFEQDVRTGLHGVYTLEPAWLTGRDPKFLSWFFASLTREPTLGIGYAQVGQENNFLWENIRPGLEPQLKVLEKLADEGAVRVETMGASGDWFRHRYAMTPPMSFQASGDWRGDLRAHWYASSRYRLGLLAEDGHLRIRDWFLYRSDYESRYYRSAMAGTKSTFDALPLLFPQIWQWEKRPFIRLLDESGAEYKGTASFRALDELRSEAALETADGTIRLTMAPGSLTVTGAAQLSADLLPQFLALEENTLTMEHRGCRYSIRVSQGQFQKADTSGFCILAHHGTIRLELGPEVTTQMLCCPDPQPPVPAPRKKYPVPLRAPEFCPDASVFRKGTEESISISARDAGAIHYTLDGSIPTKDSPVYEGPISIRENTVLTALVIDPAGKIGEPKQAEYRFTLPVATMTCETKLDPRPVFTGNGPADLLTAPRGSLDHLDGVWRGTLEDWDCTCTLETPAFVKTVSMGFLSHHRGGIVYPEWAELQTGPDAEHLRFRERILLPLRPAGREIEKQDIRFQVHEKIGAFRIVAHRYEKMPYWCTYHGVTNVFTMADNIIVE